MTKTSKKILLIVLVAILTVFAFNVKAFASVSSQEEAITWFKDSNNFKDKTVFVGQRIAAVSTDYNLTYYLKPEIKSNDTSVIDFWENSTTYLMAKNVGSTKITITCKDATGANLEQSYNVKVIKIKESKLQSKNNDIVSVTENYDENKTKVLLANGELWNIDDNTNKLAKKDTGNVKKYTFGDVYFRKGKNTKYPSVYHTLKNNNKLITKTSFGNLKAEKVEDISCYGYLTTKGKYYALVQQDDKISYKQKAKNVEKLLGISLLKKSDGLYTIDNVRIVKTKIKDALGHPTEGIYLDSKNVLYKYSYDMDSKKYKTEKIEKNVKEILDYGTYKDKNGKTKTIYKNNTNYEYKERYYVNGGFLNLKYNGKLYLGDKQILKDVVELAYVPTNYDKAYIFKKDGSIWALELDDNSSLRQVRSGKDSAKGLSVPTKVKAKKKSNSKAKVSWKKVDGATKYTVYRATSKNGKYKQVGTAKGGSYTDKTVKKGKKYFYKVVANGSKKLYNSKKSEAAKVKI